jgi:D-beta-D-heptose 7-phosphate kinase/D-beta-D-heptose 1-phosphate adenosyltransferase
LNADSSVRQIKGCGRPLNHENDRAEVLSAFEFIDYIVLFSEKTPLNLIRIIKPDILVKGGDYNAEEIVGRNYAGKIVVLPYLEGYSTTAAIKKMGM